MTTFTRTLGEIFYYTMIIFVIIAVTCCILAQVKAIPMEWIAYSTVAVVVTFEANAFYFKITE